MKVEITKDQLINDYLEMFEYAKRNGYDFKSLTVFVRQMRSQLDLLTHIKKMNKIQGNI